MWAADALKEWHDFYLLGGTAGATLLALLFVALSLGTGFLTKERHEATRDRMIENLLDAMRGNERLP
jgi:hypothetical protein